MGERAELPRLHVVTDDAILARAGWRTEAESLCEVGGEALALHVRGPTSPGARVHERAASILRGARRHGTLLVVNDRVDVALAVGADGVHLGERSLPVREARALLPGRVVGRSVHGAVALERGDADGADYAFVGTIHPTPSHEGVPGMGVSGLREAVRRAGGMPVLGIGGVDSSRVRPLLEAGAHGVAVMRVVWEHRDPARALADLMRNIEDAIA